MDAQRFTAILGTLIEDAKTAVLATVDKEDRPHMRWMTPALLADRPGAIYAVTSPDFRKVTHLENNEHGQWMFQTRMLDRIAVVGGQINVIDNSSMKAEVLEGIGRRLTVFWRVNTDASKLVVLETIMQHGFYFEPMSEVRETVTFE